MTQKNGLNGLFYSFLAIVIWLPLPLASNRLWSSMLFCVFIFFLLIVCLWHLINMRLVVSEGFRKALPIFILFTISLCWMGVQSFGGAIGHGNYSIDSFSSQQNFFLSLGYMATFALSLLLINTKYRIKQTAAVLVTSALFQALFGSFMVLSSYEHLLLIPKDSYIGVATGTFINRNSQSGYLVMCLAIGIGLMLSTLADEPATSLREHLRRWVTAILSQKIILRLSLVMIVAGLVMTHSRMGNSSFFISLMIMAPLALILTRLNKKTRRHGKSRSSLGGMLILLVSLVFIDIAVVGAFFGVDQVVQRLEATSQDRETRDEVVSSAAPLLQQVYIEGTGGGTFYTAFPEYRTFNTGNSFYDLAHNDYLQFLIEFGFIGALPLLLVCVLVFIAAIRTQLKRGDKLLRGMGFGASMSIIALALHSTVDFNLQIPANAATFMVVLALGWLSMYLPSSRSSS
jgi:O-antigen ligase